MTTYPPTRRDDVVDVLHGHRIADPYRWLEDPDAAETQDWVRQQSALTESYLAGLPERRWFARTMAAVLSRPQAGTPRRKGDRYLVSRNDGTQDQDVWYVADDLAELRRGGRVLLDPNKLSTDGTAAVQTLTLSFDGRYAAYGLSEAGSDWQDIRLLEVADGRPIRDADIQTKFTSASWLPDSRSYLYVDFPHEGEAEGTETTALGGGQLRLHRLGTPRSEDELILAFPDDDQLFLEAKISADERFAVISIYAGTENRNRLWLYPISSEQGRSRLGEPIKVSDEPVAEMVFLCAQGSWVYLQTDLDAARGRVVRMDLSGFGECRPEVQEVVPEGEHTLIAVVPAGRRLLVATLADAQPRLALHELDGRLAGVLDIAGGALVELDGELGRQEAFVGLSWVTTPTTAYRVDAAEATVEPLPDLVLGADEFVAPEVLVERRAAESPDGTRVPYFLITPPGVAAEPRPTLLYGYGGFKIPVLADYRAGWPAWLAAGGVLAVANLRGGGELGTDWHEAGRRGAKQNVFDDCIAVAEHLQATGVTTARQLALHGRSNGGLLVGAVLTQRPDLLGAALPAVGVHDMLRFARFTVGRAWVSDYGDPDDLEEFTTLLAYSPLHNVRPGTAYPPTLITTGDHDDRVVPLHSHKLAAALQHAQAGEAPVLARIEVAAGHGQGMPRSMLAAEWADLLAFAAHHTGLHPG